MAAVPLRVRRARRKARQRKGMTLNIISLIDIFTVLVFFLLLNSTELELLPDTRSVRLPESVAEARAKETVVVMVNNNDILIKEAVIAHVDDVLKSEERTIPALKAALQQAFVPSTQPAVKAPDAGAAAPADAAPAREVTIMGDREIPYRLLKKVLATCADSSYGKLSLAVLQKSGPVAPRPAS